MSSKIQGGYLACPECGSDDIEFLGVASHEVKVSAHLMFWCACCRKVLRYSLTATGTKVSAVWADVTEDV